MKRLYIKPELSSIRINSTTMLATSGVKVSRTYSTDEQYSKQFGGLVEDDFESNDNNNQVDY